VGSGSAFLLLLPLVLLSPAYFGDKMSPLSDTTNLAPAVAGTDLFSHIRAMVWTTGPTYLIVTVITILFGMKYAGGSLDAGKIDAIQAVMKSEFSISLLGLVRLLSSTYAVAKIPALPNSSRAYLRLRHVSLSGFGFADIVGALHYGYEAKLSAKSP
jgi:NhaC family Na+:H+ antiporter